MLQKAAYIVFHAAGGDQQYADILTSDEGPQRACCHAAYAGFVDIRLFPEGKRGRIEKEWNRGFPRGHIAGAAVCLPPHALKRSPIGIHAAVFVK